MKRFLFLLLGLCVPTLLAQQKIPDPLRAWEDWATWDETHLHCPSAYNALGHYFCYCPSELSLQAGANSGKFSLSVTTYHEAWMFLPGDSDLWPLNVQANGKSITVVERNGFPAMHLPPGTYRIAGDYRWTEMPQKIRVPVDYGVVTLSVEGKATPFPNWDAEGFMWLKRNRTEEGDKDFLSIQVYRLIEDGIPMWLHTAVELSVAGKSREVELGNVLPDGWSLSSVESPIPVAVDDQLGTVKVQVRAGKWFVRLRAFRTTHSPTLQMKADAKPLAERELVAFKANPEFRMLDIQNASPVDVTQTTFPQEWRRWPVYQWIVKTPLGLTEKMRGSGLQSPKSMTGTRELWLNEAGRGYTYQDHLSGQMQSIWRLDVPKSLQLGSVKVNGDGQLITRNPKTGDTGVEIRTRNLNLEARGTSTVMRAIPATGWKAGVDSLNLTLNMPPGWRLLALFGAESVDGDWLTSWTLLDLFLLLIFSLAIYKLWGVSAGMIAFLAFGLTYHEPGSARFAWFALLIPLALLRVIPEGTMRKAMMVWKFAALVFLVLVLIPFTYRQIQSVIYPQLEVTGRGAHWLDDVGAGGMRAPQQVYNAQPQLDSETIMPPPAPAEQAADESLPDVSQGYVAAGTSSSTGGTGSVGINAPSIQFRKGRAWKGKADNNLRYEAKAQIQTGPGIPDWHWRAAVCHWRGPVKADQTITPVLLPPTGRKLLVIVELILVIWLLARLLEMRHVPILMGGSRRGMTFLISFFLLFACGAVSAQQFPDNNTLETLKRRIMKPSDAFPHAAEIPSVSIQLKDDRLTFDAEIHAAVQTSVPLPGRLPAWSPVKAQIDGKADVPLRRQGGYLWAVVPEGVHHVKVEGLLPAASEWEWSFLLKPRTVTIDAPGWNVTGLKRDGTPEQQIFFARKQAGGGKEDVGYDRREFHTLAVVDRTLEIGLTWQIHNTVTRLSAPGKAVALQIPMLVGEQILSSGITPTNGNVEVRLAVNQNSFSWESELSPVNEIQLTAPKTDRWVERWSLVSSPVWNVTLSGLEPIIESQEERLTPVWHPWPGEAMKLSITRPEAVSGPTKTIHRVFQQFDLGNGERKSTLRLSLQCSVGDDLVVGLDPSADITSVRRGSEKIPVRREAGNLIIPIQPGNQEIEILWKEARPLGFCASLSRLELPVESSNITTVVQPPANRWVLWAHGPVRGPAVRFWSVLVCALLAACILGGLPRSPLSRTKWALLMVGLTQVSMVCALIVILWLFLLAYRGTDEVGQANPIRFDLLQILIVLVTAISLAIFVGVVYQGLLGNPRMFILGNGSSPNCLNWYAAQAPKTVPRPGMISVSVWFYRVLMLFWALWLSNSLIRWLTWGWKQFSQGGWWRSAPKAPKPPVLPKQG
jgi:hypothetical protein